VVGVMGSVADGVRGICRDTDVADADSEVVAVVEPSLKVGCG
jgi:hypothetical protein